MLPAFSWAAVIFVVISMPSDQFPETPLLRLPHADKAVHFFLFAIFGVLLILGFRNESVNRQVRASHILTALMTGLAYGVLTEYYQHCCLPGRHGNIPDIIANAFGTVFGVISMAVIIQSGIKKIKSRN